jgi:hypothetical protein
MGLLDNLEIRALGACWVAAQIRGIEPIADDSKPARCFAGISVNISR